MNENIQGTAGQVKERDYWFDNAKTILILLVVIGHLTESLISYTDFTNGCPVWISTLGGSIYIFHMPVFVIISGRFSRDRIDRNDWISVINRLVLPYLFIQLVMMFFDALTGAESISKFSFLSPLFGLWYLFSIAIYQLITARLKTFKPLFAVAMLLAVLMQFGEAVPNGGFMRVFTYYPFFLFGYYTSKCEFKFCKNIFFRIISVVAFAALFAFVWIYVDQFTIGALTMKRVYASVAKYFTNLSQPDFLIYTLLHYTAGFIFFFFLLGISPSRKLKGYSYIGSQSIYVYILHLFIILYIKHLNKKYGFMNLFDSDIKAALFILSGIPLALFLASAPVRKATSWLVTPKFDIRRYIKCSCKDCEM